jgi:tripartite-type tricarboxylate transporter receptor subunit TctC
MIGAPDGVAAGTFGGADEMGGARAAGVGRPTLAPGGGRMQRRRGLFALIVLLAAGLACRPAAAPSSPPGAPPDAAAAAPRAAKPAGPPAAAGESFAGKTVTLSVNYSAGGPTDVFARMIQPFLEKHIPGRPTVVVENRAGAGGLIGKNHVYNLARQDGTTLGVFSNVFGHQVVGSDNVQYDAARYQWLGGTADSSVAFVHRDVGARTMRELVSTPNQIIAGGLAPESLKDMIIRTSLNLVGAKYRYVTGYPGSADARLAFQRGEINFYEDGLTSWNATFAALQKDGTAVPLGQRGIIRDNQVVRDPRVADLPTLNELAVQIKGEGVRSTVEYRALAVVVGLQSITQAVLAPPNTPPRTVAMLRQALSDTFADPEFHATGEKQLGYPLETVDGLEAQSQAEKLIRDAHEDGEAIEYMRQLAQERN